MAYLTTEWVKERFPLWGSYFINESRTPDEEALESEIEMAAEQMKQYVDFDEENITGPLKIHLLNIVRKRGYDREKPETENEFTISVIRDYNETIKILQLMKQGEISSPSTAEEGNERIRITSDKSEFGEWFI